MAFDPTGVLNAVKSFLANSGRFKGVSIGAPNAPPASTFAAVWLEGFRPVMEQSGMTSLSGIVNLNVRLYRLATNEPNETVEVEMGKTVFELLEDFCGDFDFGDASVRAFDPGGSEIRIEEVEYKGAIYTIADLSVPLLVNDVATFAR